MLIGTDPAWDYVEAIFDYSTGQCPQHSSYCHIGHGPCVHRNVPDNSSLRASRDGDEVST